MQRQRIEEMNMTLQSHQRDHLEELHRDRQEDHHLQWHCQDHQQDVQLIRLQICWARLENPQRDHQEDCPEDHREGRQEEAEVVVTTEGQGTGDGITTIIVVKGQLDHQDRQGLLDPLEKVEAAQMDHQIVTQLMETWEVFTLPHLIRADSARTPCSPWTVRGLGFGGCPA
jgi:hypothetical protein